MPFANLEVFFQLFVDLGDFIVLRHDKVDLWACLLNLTLASVEIILLLLPILAQISPFLFFSRKLLNLLSDLILKLLFLDLLIRNMELPFFAVLFFIGDLWVINWDDRIQVWNVLIESLVLVFNFRKILVEMSLFPKQTSNVGLSFVAFIGDALGLIASHADLSPAFFDLLL